MKNITKFATGAVSIAFIASLTACSNSSDTSPMQTGMEIETENSAEIIDPGSILSSLQFDTAENQTSYQCLLSAATDTATSEGMQAFPVWFNDDPTSGRGSFQTWCKTSGEGALVDDDLDRCTQASVGLMQAPGTKALSVKTTHFSDNVSTISHTSKSIPEVGTAGWAVSFAKTFGGPSSRNDRLIIGFQRFDGTQLVEESGSLQHPYAYRDDVIGLMEFVDTDRTVNDYLAEYSASTSQFKSTADSYLTAVMALIEEAIRGKVDLSADEINSALARANTEINQSKEFFNLNGDELHQLLLTRENYLDCEGESAVPVTILVE